MESLQEKQSLFVHQKKEWGEVLTGFETKNRYVVCDSLKHELFFAAEKSSFLLRQFLGGMRPLTIQVVSLSGDLVLQFERPFRFFFHEIHVMDSSGRKLGMIKKHFSILNKRFSVRNSMGQDICKLFGPLIHPWTFRILKNDSEVGKIVKRFSGLGTEIFTDADNFSVDFPQGASFEEKSILLGALFLIDILYFENKK